MKTSLLVLCLVVLAPAALAQTTYRWVDANGRVNYGNAPPPGVQATPLDPGKSKLSVVPSAPKAAPPAEPAPSATASDAALRERVSKLEGQLEAERAQRASQQAAAGSAEKTRLERAREECEAQRRVNCDTDPYGTSDPGLIVVQPVVRRPYPHHPPYAKPYLPPPPPKPTEPPRREPSRPGNTARDR